MPKKDSSDDNAEARIASRLSLRLVGRPVEGRPTDAASIPEGPELIGPITEIPTRSARAEPIRRQLLDAAEVLFARWGYTGVSIRDITDLAGTRLADVTYYFGSKQNLYFAVLKRRAEPLGEKRIAALRQCEALGLSGRAFVAAWVTAYMDPAVELLASGEPGWDHYLRLIGHVAYSRLWPDMLKSFYNDVAERFIEALRREFPDASDIRIQHSFLMLTAASMYTLARTGRVETFANPAFSSDDIALLGPLTREFVVAGILGLLPEAR